MKAHEVVMAWMTEQLASGRLQVGDRLPGERALAETLEVSRPSLREAFRVLEALGMLRSGTGSGPASGTIIAAEPEQGLSLALNLQLATRHVEHEHVVAARVLLESWAARNSQSTLGEWDEAERLLGLMEDPQLPLEQFLDLDARFHAVLTRAAGNPLISTLMDALRLSISEYTVMHARALGDWELAAQRLRQEHRTILEQLRGGETEGAAVLLRDHINGYYGGSPG